MTIGLYKFYQIVNSILSLQIMAWDYVKHLSLAYNYEEWNHEEAVIYKMGEKRSTSSTCGPKVTTGFSSCKFIVSPISSDWERLMNSAISFL